MLSPSFSSSRVPEPLLFLSSLLPPLLQSKLEDLSHHPHFSSNLVGSKVASWAGAGSRWLHAQGDHAKALQVLTPPLPRVPGWGGSGLGNLPELSGMTSRLPLHHPLLCSHMAPAMGSLSWVSDLRKINCGRAGEGKPHSLGWVYENESIHQQSQSQTFFFLLFKAPICGILKLACFYKRNNWTFMNNIKGSKVHFHRLQMLYVSLYIW